MTYEKESTHKSHLIRKTIYMSNTQQWIPLGGPGSRLPTEADANAHGYVYVATYETGDLRLWNSIRPHWTHWCPVPKSPPLPKPVEKTQEEKDKEAFFKYWRTTPNAQQICGRDGESIFIDATRYGRSDGRKQLAQEALALFKIPASNLKEIVEKLASIEWENTANAINGLHELLTEAAR